MLIKEFCKIINGATPSTNNSNYWDGDIAWITPDDLSKHNGIYIQHGKRYLTLDGYASCSTTIVPRDTILLTSRAPIGYVAIASNELCTNQGFKSLICDANVVNNLYLYYWILSHIDFLRQISSGSTFRELSKEALGNIDIELPNLDSQQHIVDTI